MTNQVDSFFFIMVMKKTDIALQELNSSTVKFQGETIHHVGENDDDLLFEGPSSLSEPEQSLLKCLNIDGLLAFIKQYVVNGRTTELRSVSSSVARKIACQFPSSDKNRLFECLVGGPFREVGMLGCSSSNFCDLLRSFIESFGSELNLENAAGVLMTLFMSQMTHLNHYYTQNADSGGSNCDLSDCVHCKKQTSAKKTAKSSSKRSDTSNQSTSSKEADDFLPDQVRPYQKGRLEASTAANVSSEFSSYNQVSIYSFNYYSFQCSLKSSHRISLSPLNQNS